MRGSAIAITAAVGGALLVPASPLAEEPPAPPTAVLEAPSAAVKAGAPLQLDSSASRPGGSAIVGHVWDLDGNGSFEKDTGPRPTVELTPSSPGKLTVQVRVVDDLNQTGDAQLELNVTGRPKQMAYQRPTVGHVDDSPPPKSGGRENAVVNAAPDLVPKHALASRTAVVAARVPAKPKATATAAASKRVTIKGFKYSPATASVHTGDTITWTNQDQAPHTATANDKSFDTGTINKGKSGSHKFTKAGTFSYICTVHPSMKGTVTVLGASSGGTAAGSGGTNSGGSGSSGSNGSASSSGGSGLPHTGLEIAVVVLIAALMMGSGTLLRQVARRDH